MFLVHFDYSNTYFMFFSYFLLLISSKISQKNYIKYIFNIFACVIILLKEEGEEEEKERKSSSYKGAKLQIMQDWGGQDYYLRSF